MTRNELAFESFCPYLWCPNKKKYIINATTKKEQRLLWNHEKTYSFNNLNRETLKNVVFASKLMTVSLNLISFKFFNVKFFGKVRKTMESNFKLSQLKGFNTSREHRRIPGQYSPVNDIVFYVADNPSGLTSVEGKHFTYSTRDLFDETGWRQCGLGKYKHFSGSKLFMS